VLAAGERALRAHRSTYRALFPAEEHGLELHHPEFTNSSVGSFTGTSELEGITAALRAEIVEKVERISA